jgi:membrane-associated protease RseP (regulator of RpoE activity)
MTLYKSFRDEMMAGGSTEERPEGESTSRTTAVVSGVVIAGLLVWLGFSNPWSLLLVFGLLISVFLHEVGHFVTAGWAGMKRTQFFMGFGPRLWSTHRNGVEYGVRALPLGAFVRIVGMNNLDPVESGDEDVAYVNKPYRWRMLVITAGSLMHGIIAVVLLLGVYTIGGRFQETGDVRVTGVSVDSPAMAAGLVNGDVIRTIDGRTITSTEDMRSYVRSRSAGEVITIDYERDGRLQSTSLTLAAVSDPSTAPTNEQSARPGFMGVASDDFARESIPVWEAAGHVGGDLARSVWATFEGIATVANPFNQIEQLTNEDADPATRPTTVVGITMIAGDIGEEYGLWAVLEILASINIFVGIFNLFPMLPFDGGHAAIATYERIRSRKGRVYRADVEKLWPVTVAVLGMLIFLTFTGLYLDITRPF